MTTNADLQPSWPALVAETRAALVSCSGHTTWGADMAVDLAIGDGDAEALIGLRDAFRAFAAEMPDDDEPASAVDDGRDPWAVGPLSC